MNNTRLFAKSFMAFLASALLFIGAPAEGEQCWRNALEPAVPLSAVWSGESVVLTDAKNTKIYKISLSDDGSIEIGVESDTDLRPAGTARRTDGGFLQYTRSANTLHWFDAGLREKGFTNLDVPLQKSRIDLAASKATWSNRVIELYNWTVVGDSIFAYGLLGDSGNANRLIYSFFVYQLRSPGSRNVVPKGQRVLEFPYYEYYALDFPYMAAIGSNVYFMTLYNFPEVYFYDTRQSDAGARYLRAGNEVPFLNRPVPPIDNEKMLLDIDADSVPMGLYSSGTSLHVLYRELAGEDLRWRLFELDPDPVRETVRSRGSVTLPVREDARYVTMLPLPERESWLAFEIAGGSDGRTRGNVLSMIEIPQAWIDPENAGSPLSAAIVGPGLCRRPGD